MPYEQHWFHTVPAEDILRGVPSDCSDRVWVSADWCEENQVSFRLVWSLLTKRKVSLHVAIMVEGYIYDTKYRLYEMSYHGYKRILGDSLFLSTSGWIRRYITVGE